MPICNVCGGYFIRAPCPICAEEHVPNTMSPSYSSGMNQENLRAEVSVEGSINSSIQNAQDQIKQVKEDIQSEKEKWAGQIKDQKDQFSELEIKIADLSKREQLLTTNVLSLKEAKAKLQVSQNKLMEGFSKLEQEVDSMKKSKQENESKLQFLKDEFASLGA